MKNLLHVEDHASARTRIQLVLNRVFKGITLYEASTLSLARQRLKETIYDLVILDISLPDGSGLSLINEIFESCPKTHIIITTIFDDDGHLFPALKAGVHGYLLKDQHPDEMEALLRGTMLGTPPLSPAIARRILSHFRAMPGKVEVDDLTPRETEVLTLVAKGLSRTDISRLLGITVNTTSEYIKKVYQKLSVNNRSEAALEAIRLGLVNPRC